jgi:hypothetical protein
MISRIDCRHRKISTGRHFQNCCHNTVKFNIVRFQRPELIPDIEKFLPDEMALKSDNVEFVRHCGGHFENGDW